MEIAGVNGLGMQIRWLFFAVAGAFLTSCGSAASTQRVQGGTGGTVTATNVVVIDAVPAAEESVPRPGNNDYKSTDPTTVVLAKGHPQLIEFYADW